MSAHTPTGEDRSSMTVEVRLFAILRERYGSDRLQLELPRGATVAEALAGLSEIDLLGELLGRLPVRMAVNRDYASAETVLQPADELALIPPVSGGAPAGLQESDAGFAPHVEVTEEPLAADRVARRVADPRAGAIVTFQGVTREIDLLVYEAYVEMAHERIAVILLECMTEHQLCAAAAEHRVGEVPLGEPSVIVCASAPHREQAFAGARQAIDRIKAEAPIWKSEHTAGAPGRWVAGSEPPL
jgi:molybdopterin synthase catalytic subunit